MNRYDNLNEIDDMSVTLVSNAFINHYMTNARGDFVKVYLYGLKLSSSPSMVFPTNLEVAAALKLSETDVINAWKHWEQEGIVNVIMDGVDQIIEFRALIPYLFAGAKREKVQKPKNRPKVEQMFRDLEEKLSRLLAHNEKLRFLRWLEEYKFTPQTVVLLVSECIDRSKRDFYYWEAVARNYFDNNITTVDQAMDYINAYKARRAGYKDVLNYLGLYRAPSAAEMRLVDKWRDEFGLTLEEIKKACDETAAASNPNLKYVDKILMNARGEVENSASGEQDKRSRRVYSRKKTELEPDYDFDEIERILFDEWSE